jgi:hypothetical protein
MALAINWALAIDWGVPIKILLFLIIKSNKIFIKKKIYIYIIKMSRRYFR